MPLRTVVIEDQQLLRDLLVGAVRGRPDLEIVGAAASLAAGRALLATGKLDLLVLDLQLPDGNGLELVREVQAHEARIVIVTGLRDPASAREALLLGVDAFVCKDESYDVLLRALDETIAGRPYYSPQALALLRPASGGGVGGDGALSDLTSREREVLVAVAQGAGIKETAARYGIAPPTVKTHRLNLMRKLGIHDVAGLTRFALAQGLVRLTD